MHNKSLYIIYNKKKRKKDIWQLWYLSPVFNSAVYLFSTHSGLRHKVETNYRSRLPDATYLAIE